MTEDRRGRYEPVPKDLSEYLTPEQLASLDGYTAEGWEITFVRRVLFKDPVVVLRNNDTLAFAILNGDGTLNESPVLKCRSSDCQPPE